MKDDSKICREIADDRHLLDRAEKEIAELREKLKQQEVNKIDVMEENIFLKRLLHRIIGA